MNWNRFIASNGTGPSPIRSDCRYGLQTGCYRGTHADEQRKKGLLSERIEVDEQSPPARYDASIVFGHCYSGWDELMAVNDKVEIDGDDQESGTMGKMANVGCIIMSNNEVMSPHDQRSTVDSGDEGPGSSHSPLYGNASQKRANLHRRGAKGLEFESHLQLGNGSEYPLSLGRPVIGLPNNYRGSPKQVETPKGRQTMQEAVQIQWPDTPFLGVSRCQRLRGYTSPNVRNSRNAQVRTGPSPSIGARDIFGDSLHQFRNRSVVHCSNSETLGSDDAHQLFSTLVGVADSPGTLLMSWCSKDSTTSLRVIGNLMKGYVCQPPSYFLPPADMVDPDLLKDFEPDEQITFKSEKEYEAYFSEFGSRTSKLSTFDQRRLGDLAKICTEDGLVGYLEGPKGSMYRSDSRDAIRNRRARRGFHGISNIDFAICGIQGSNTGNDSDAENKPTGGESNSTRQRSQSHEIAAGLSIIDRLERFSLASFTGDAQKSPNCGDDAECHYREDAGRHSVSQIHRNHRVEEEPRGVDSPHSTLSPQHRLYLQRSTGSSQSTSKIPLLSGVCEVNADKCGTEELPRGPISSGSSQLRGKRTQVEGQMKNIKHGLLSVTPIIPSESGSFTPPSPQGRNPPALFTPKLIDAAHGYTRSGGNGSPNASSASARSRTLNQSLSFSRSDVKWAPPINDPGYKPVAFSPKSMPCHASLQSCSPLTTEVQSPTPSTVATTTGMFTSVSKFAKDIMQAVRNQSGTRKSKKRRGSRGSNDTENELRGNNSSMHSPGTSFSHASLASMSNTSLTPQLLPMFGLSVSNTGKSELQHAFLPLSLARSNTVKAKEDPLTSPARGHLDQLEPVAVTDDESKQPVATATQVDSRCSVGLPLKIPHENKSREIHSTLSPVPPQARSTSSSQALSSAPYVRTRKSSTAVPTSQPDAAAIRDSPAPTPSSLLSNKGFPTFQGHSGIPPCSNGDGNTSTGSRSCSSQAGDFISAVSDHEDGDRSTSYKRRYRTRSDASQGNFSNNGSFGYASSPVSIEVPALSRCSRHIPQPIEDNSCGYVIPQTDSPSKTSAHSGQLKVSSDKARQLKVRKLIVPPSSINSQQLSSYELLPSILSPSSQGVLDSAVGRRVANYSPTSDGSTLGGLLTIHNSSSTALMSPSTGHVSSMDRPLSGGSILTVDDDSVDSSHGHRSLANTPVNDCKNGTGECSGPPLKLRGNRSPSSGHGHTAATRSRRPSVISFTEVDGCAPHRKQLPTVEKTWVASSTSSISGNNQSPHLSYVVESSLMPPRRHTQHYPSSTTPPIHEASRKRRYSANFSTATVATDTNSTNHKLYNEQNTSGHSSEIPSRFCIAKTDASTTSSDQPSVPLSLSCASSRLRKAKKDMEGCPLVPEAAAYSGQNSEGKGPLPVPSSGSLSCQHPSDRSNPSNAQLKRGGPVAPSIAEEKLRSVRQSWRMTRQRSSSTFTTDTDGGEG